MSPRPFVAALPPSAEGVAMQRMRTYLAEHRRLPPDAGAPAVPFGYGLVPPAPSPRRPSRPVSPGFQSKQDLTPS